MMLDATYLEWGRRTSLISEFVKTIASHFTSHEHPTEPRSSDS